MTATPDCAGEHAAQRHPRPPSSVADAEWQPRHRAWAPRHRAARRPRLLPQPPSLPAALLAVLAACGLLVGASVGGDSSANGLITAVSAAPAARTPAASPPIAAASTELADPAAYARLAGQLRKSLDLADLRRSVPRSFSPGVRSLRRSLWDGSLECGATAREYRHDVCIFGDRRGSRTVVALGSSHMTMWMSGLARTASERDTRLVGLIKFGCPPYELRTTREGREWRSCGRFREWAVDQVAAIEPDIVLVGSHSDFTVLDEGSRLLSGAARTQAIAEGAGKLTARLLEHAGSVVVLGDTTPRSKEPGACLRRTGRSFHRCEAPADAEHRSLVDATEDAVRSAGADFFDTSLLTCVDQSCPVAAARRYIYRDSTHITRLWSRHVADLLATEVGIR